jgi:hypothetical protein
MLGVSLGKEIKLGNRSLIIIRSSSFGTNEIRLYGHWSGEENINAVRNVLARTDRVGDESYLTAQLFHEFAVTLGGYDGGIGFGISLASSWDDEGWIDSDTVIVDADTGNYTYGDEGTIAYAGMRGLASRD